MGWNFRKIDIQIRAGDNAFKDDPNVTETAWKMAAAHFACAAEIEKTRASPGQRVIFFVMSDSVTLRQATKARLGNKLLTEMETPSLHIGSVDGGSCQAELQIKASRLAVGDMLSKWQTIIFTQTTAGLVVWLYGAHTRGTTSTLSTTAC